MKKNIYFKSAFIVAEAINNSDNTSATFNRMKEIFNEAFNEAKERYSNYKKDKYPSVIFYLTPRQNELFDEIFNPLCCVNHIYNNVNPNNKSYEEIEFEVEKKGFDMMVECFHLEEYAWTAREINGYLTIDIMYKEVEGDDVLVKKSEATFVPRGTEIMNGEEFIKFEHYTIDEVEAAETETTVEVEPTVEAEVEVEPTHKPMSVSPMASAVEMSLIYNMHKEGVNIKIDGWDCNTLFIIVENGKDAVKVMEHTVSVYNISDMRYIKETNTVMVRFE